MIVCMGDSITYGQHVSRDKAWPELIQDHDIISAGIPSDTTRLALERFPRDVQERLPAGVVIQFGHNDANRWQTDRGLPRVSVKAFAANLEEMVTRCRVFEAYPMLCTITPSRRSKEHALDVTYYDKVLRDTALVIGVQLIDVRAAFGDADGLLLDDGLHLSVKGHEVYAAAVQAELDTRFR